MSSTFKITTADGLTLIGRRWPVAPANRRGRALLIHGVGEHSARYDEVAGVLNALGIEVVGYDQRGFGQSQGPRGAIPNAMSLVEDAEMVFELVRSEGLQEPAPFLVAHSMGGTIAAYAVAVGRISPRGLVLSSPAIAPRLSPTRERVLRGLLKWAPNLSLSSGIAPEDVTRDTAEQQKIRIDPYFHTKVTPRLILAIVDQGRAASSKASAVRTPTLLLIAGADRVVDPIETLLFFAHLPPATATLREYRGLFHEVFNELPQDRRQVLSDLESWLRQQI